MKFQDLELEKLIKDSEQIPSLPSIFYRVTEAINDPDSTLEEIGNIVASDMALAARILKVVNSPYFGLEDKIEALPHALNIIGVDQLSNMVLATSVMSQFKGIPEDFVTMESFWAHSIACGLAAREIAQFDMSKIKETLYLGGMIHDIGSLIIYKEIPELGREALERCNNWGQKLVDAEKSVMGFDHTEVGTALLTHWELSEVFKEMIFYHHAPWQAPNYPKEASVIYLADYIIHCNQLGSSGELQCSPLNRNVLDILNISKEAIPEISEKTIKLFEETVQIFSN